MEREGKDGATRATKVQPGRTEAGRYRHTDQATREPGGLDGMDGQAREVPAPTVLAQHASTSGQEVLVRPAGAPPSHGWTVPWERGQAGRLSRAKYRLPRSGEAGRYPLFFSALSGQAGKARTKHAHRCADEQVSTASRRGLPGVADWTDLQCSKELHRGCWEQMYLLAI